MSALFLPTLPAMPMITIWSPEACGTVIAGAGGQSITSASSTAWPAANLAIFFPLKVQQLTTFTKMLLFCGSTVAATNVDGAIYDRTGVKLTSDVHAAQGSANTVQLLDWTDLTLGPGLYYAALVLDTGTGTVFRATAGTVYTGAQAGLLEMASAYPLPPVATFANYTTADYLPVFGPASRSTI